MSGIVIGMDPHKVSVTIEVRDEREVLLGTGRFGTDTGGYKAMLGYCRQWPRRTWAVEGANGTGRPTAQRLLADGERVLDVPAKLAARARVFDTGHARETDAHDAHAIVMVALRTQGLRELTVDEGLAVLRLLADRRDELSRSRAQILNRLQRLLVELVPGGAKRELSSFKARDLLATVWPRDLPGRTAASSPSTWWGGLESPSLKLREPIKRLRRSCSSSHPMGILGIGPAGAARILADVGDVARFPDRAHFASWTSTARSTPRLVSTRATGCPGPGTGGSITCST
jgi:transposase